MNCSQKTLFVRYLITGGISWTSYLMSSRMA